MGKTSLPPGFRFHPMDDELVMYYLKKKVMGKKMPFEVISELDIYKFVPQDLPDKSCLKSRDREWYFFCPRARKYASGGRMNRTTESGYWKTTGKDRQVVYENRTVGQIRTLIFHQGRAPKGDRTDWVMHEYRLEDKVLVDRGIVQDAFVLCKIFQKSGPGPKNGAQYGAPFNEEEWNSEDEADHIESLPFSSIDMPAMVLNDNQSNSILRDTVGPEDTPSGFPSNSGPSQSLPSADMVLPSVPDGDIFELPVDNELMSMLDMFEDSNENDENEVDKPSHAQNVDNALPNVDDALTGEGNDIFKDLGDLGKLAEMNEDGFNFSSSHKGNHSLDQWPPADSFLELRDLDHPLKITVEGSGSGFVPPGGVCMDCDCCNNSEHFDHPFNDFGVRHHASASIPNPPVLADRSYGFENLMDLFSKRCVGENAKQGYGGYESASYSTEQSEPDSGHVAQTHKRGEQQTKYYSRFQQLLESIPSRPASAAEHPGSSNGLRKNTRTVLCASVGVGGCTEEALSDKLELSCLGYCGCNLHRRREFRKEAALWDGNFMFVLFLGMLSALMWVFIAAILMKLGRFAWDLLLA